MSAGKQRLSDEHRRELEGQSVIDTAIVAERGYETITADQSAYLSALGIQVRSRDAYPGLLLPMFRATGERISAQFKPAKPIVLKRGRTLKYLSPLGQPNHIDVHPRNRERIGGVFTDIGISGAKERRPQLDQLLADCRKRLFDVVAVYRYDRFARSVRQLVNALAEFDALGIPMLEERNTRKGFFELEMLHGVLEHLPQHLQPVIEFAYITGWRIPSEVLPLEWRQVDLKAGEVRLDPETTKNREARVFPITDDLRALLELRWAERERLKSSGHIVRWVFFRMVATKRKGPKEPRPIRAFSKSWAVACIAAGCPGRIPHDLRRTAVRNMVRRRVPERVAMQLAGHKTRSVFERYNIVSSGDLRSAAEQLRGLTRVRHDSTSSVSEG